MERRGQKINMEKTKVIVSGRNHQQDKQRGRFPCRCCGRDVGAKSILSSTCSVVSGAKIDALDCEE